MRRGLYTDRPESLANSLYDSFAGTQGPSPSGEPRPDPSPGSPESLPRGSLT